MIEAVQITRMTDDGMEGKGNILISIVENCQNVLMIHGLGESVVIKRCDLDKALDLLQITDSN